MSLDELTPGFGDAVHDAQRCYRLLLDASARPGRILTLPDDMLAALQPPPPLAPGLAALLLTLLDSEVGIALLGRFDSELTRHWLRFHTGVGPAPLASAAFTAALAEEVPHGLWSQLPRGTDAEPQNGGTLIVEVPRLDAEPSRDTLLLSGPGIETEQRLRVAGLPPSFWAERAALARDRPRGVELVLTAGARLVAIPRSTRIDWVG